ncbi:hypothetical protein [Neisseria sp. Ec49-e6-T10]|uniref:hypothetical protein n=1 Tax=Neisseria sp. Ec49-e6-T10 TaxID=3140744 RepID=UPI003EBEF04F
MKKIKVEKYINNELDETLTIPVAFINILTSILPKSAIEELNQAGLDFQSMIQASKQGQNYHASTQVTEKGISKQIVLTLI